MEEILRFFEQTPTFFFSTVGVDGKPKVRPFGFLKEFDGKLHLCTNNQKSVYAELQKNPYCELCAVSADRKWLRVSGKAVFTKDISIKEAVMDESPGVKKLYQSAANPIFEVFYLEEVAAILFEVTNPPHVIAI